MASLPYNNIACALALRAKERPHQIAVHCPAGTDDQGRVSYTHLTFQQLDRESDLLARGLRANKIGDGTRTVLMVTPSLEFFALTFALFKAGAIPVLVDPGMGVRNLRKCLKEAQPEAFIGIPKAHIARILLGWGRKTIRTLVTVGSKRGWKGLTLDAIRQAGSGSEDSLHYEGSADETAAILFTSGSTGVPKGAIYSHRIFVTQVLKLQQMYGIEPGEVDLSTFPLFALFAPALGMTAVIPDMDPTRPAQVDPVKIFNAIEAFGVSNMFGSPALIRQVGRWGEQNDIHLSSLRRVISAGAPVPATVLETFSGLLPEGTEIHTPYGATEALPVATMNSQAILQETRYRTDVGKGVCVGRPVDDLNVAVIGISEAPIARWSDRLRLGSNDIGEICVHGDQVTQAYFNREKSTRLAKIWDPQSDRQWHRMGDLGYMDEEGRIWFCGRKSHRVIGERKTWYTIPVEAVFNTHTEVYRTALVGLGKTGRQTPVLCVELTPETDPSEWPRIKGELENIAGRFSHTEAIERFLLHPAFPVDIRHNAKIFREKLAVWAKRQKRKA